MDVRAAGVDLADRAVALERGQDIAVRQLATSGTLPDRRGAGNRRQYLGDGKPRPGRAKR